MLAVGCQSKDEHPPFLPSCETVCAPLPGIVVGSSSGGSSGMEPASDAGPASLTGQVLLLNDDSFARASLYTSGATVSADGVSGTRVSAKWDGADPYLLEDVLRAATSWVSVKPDLVAGDALLTYQAVQTTSVRSVDLVAVSAASLDAVFNAVSLLRKPSLGQVVLFFHNAGTGAAVQGLHVVLPKAELAAYRSGTGWLLDDGSAVTDQSGLVLFGNVDPAGADGTQTVTVTRAATATSPASSAGQFAVKVVQAAATIATVNVQR